MNISLEEATLAYMYASRLNERKQSSLATFYVSLVL